MSIERRELHRRRTYLAGKISFDASYCVVDCLIRDMSRNGARLAFSSTAIVPSHFDLLVPKHGSKLRAELIWREADQVGVAFLD
jgi:hypothetical protein